MSVASRIGERDDPWAVLRRARRGSGCSSPLIEMV